jgi:hypothetical protein
MSKEIDRRLFYIGATLPFISSINARPGNERGSVFPPGLDVSLSLHPAWRIESLQILNLAAFQNAMCAAIAL